MKIFIVGSGKLANAILSSGLTFQTAEIMKWETTYQTLDEKGILVHAGSGRELKECVEFCARTKSVFVELATGLETEQMQSSFPLVICPNTSILLLKTMNMINANGGNFSNYEISITESHQSTKITEAGTASAFANALQFPLDKIVSIRDPKIQETEIGIPQAYLGKHAYHKIVIKDDCDEITLETKVLGHHSYAKGVKVILDSLLMYSLENKSYTIFDLIDNKML